MMAKRRGLTDIIQPNRTILPSIGLTSLSREMPYFIQRDTTSSDDKGKGQSSQQKATEIVVFQPYGDIWIREITDDAKSTNKKIQRYLLEKPKQTILEDLDTFINATPEQFKILDPLLGKITPPKPITDENIKYRDNVCKMVKKEAGDIKKLCKSYEITFENAAATKTIKSLLDESQKSIEKERDRLGIKKEEKTFLGVHYGDQYKVENDKDTVLKEAAKELLDRQQTVKSAWDTFNSIPKYINLEVSPDGVPTANPKVSPEWVKAKEKLDSSEKDYNNLRFQKESTNPILVTYQLDPFRPETAEVLKKLASDSQEARAETLGEEINEKLSKIQSVREKIESKHSRIWRLPSVVEATKVSNLPDITQYSELDESLRNTIVAEKVAKEEFEKVFIDIALPVLAVGAAILATPAAGAAVAGAGAGGAAVAGTAVVIDAGLTIAMGARSLQEYQFETAAQGTDFDKAKVISQGEEPSLFWLAMDLLPIAGMAVTAAKGALKAAQGTFKSLAALRREAIAAKSAMELSEAGSSASKVRYQKALTELEATGNQAKEGRNLGTKLKDEVSKIEGAALEKAGAKRLIVAEKVAADGHTIKISADGRIFVCTTCEEIGQRFSHELGLPQNGKLASELSEIEAIADATEKSRRAALLEGKLVSEGATRFGQELEKMGLKSEIIARLTAEEVYRTRHGLLELVANDINKLNILLPQFKDTVVLERLLTKMGEPVVTNLAPALGEAGLVNLEKLDMFKLAPDKQELLKNGLGAVVRKLPPIEGMSINDVHSLLTANGFTNSATVNGMEMWIHTDGSIVRIKTASPALNTARPIENAVKEISKTPGDTSVKAVFAKVADNGSVVPQGTNFAEESLKQWFKKQTGKVPTPNELDAMMKVWGDASHITLTP
jgi:hypothetical protein